MTEQVVEAIVLKGSLNHPQSRVAVPGPAERTEALTATSAVFPRARFEILGNASRLTGRGKFAHVRTSSAEFAQRKQEEIELEERSR
jgi:hypothetical protein